MLKEDEKSLVTNQFIKQFLFSNFEDRLKKWYKGIEVKGTYGTLSEVEMCSIGIDRT